MFFSGGVGANVLFPLRGGNVSTGVFNLFGVWVCVSMGVNMSHTERDVN